MALDTSAFDDPIVDTTDPTTNQRYKAFDDSTTLTGVGYGIQGAAQIGGAFEQYTALKAQGEFQKTMAQINQQYAGVQAKSVINQGNELADQVQAKGRAVVGSQRAAAAAQGIDVNDSNSSVANKIDDTKLAVAHDVVTAKNNAWQQAWGITTNAANNVSSAKFAQSGANFAANSTLLTGGLRATGDFALASGKFRAGGTAQKNVDVSTQSKVTDTTNDTGSASDSGDWWANSEDV